MSGLEEEEDRSAFPASSRPPIKSYWIKDPPLFSNEPGPSDTKRRSESPISSRLSMKSDRSKGKLPDFSNEPGPSNTKKNKRSHVSVEEQPVLLYCFVSGRPEGSSLYQLWTLVLQTVHQLILGPVCFIRRLLLSPVWKKDPEPELDCRQPVRPAVYKVRLNICLLLSSTDVGLQEVLDEHKISLRRRCERVTEGSDEAGSETLPQQDLH
ncbi:hypothetical protein L3Q82_018412 [Scortum barcoo]|uniref:Uncharacterized protein n=1 Tax=Scortum barcoo TaxID=214431 RepID=A0ACB8VJZ8_9TELE|nr:hypothetical protein L3Q82_018412 [Scortum barcoo]